MITILYFARLKENLGVASETLDSPPASVAALLDLLRGRGGIWAEELAPGRALRAAVNQEMVPFAAALADGDEVALFPPVTGG